MPTKEKRPESGNGPPRVLVAIPTSFQQEVVRFYLKDAGYQILGMVPSGPDLIARAGDQQPEAVVLHESVAAAPGPGLIQELRKVTPSTKIVVLAAAPDEAWRGPARGADAFLEEGVGIASLKGVLAELCGATGIRQEVVWIDTDGQAAPAGAEDREEMAPIPLPAAPGRGVLWYERFRGAAAAAILLLALFKGPQLFLATAPSSGPDGAVASGPLAGAFSSFNLLVTSLRTGAPPAVLMGEARNLYAARAAAVATGADVRDLDAAIAAQVPPLLKNVSPETASTISAILGDLVPVAPPVAAPSPSPSATPGPVGSPSPVESPTPIESPNPSPVQSPSPSPNESPSPSASASPSESPSPDPSESPSPSASPGSSDSPSPSGSPSPTGLFTPGGTLPSPGLGVAVVFASLPLISWRLRIRTRTRSPREG